MDKKTKIKAISVGGISLFYALAFLSSYHYSINPGFFLILAVITPAFPSLIDYYFKKRKISCVRCGAKNAYDDTFCSKCGLELGK